MAETTEFPTVITYNGRNIEELSRAELIEGIRCIMTMYENEVERHESTMEIFRLARAHTAHR